MSEKSSPARRTFSDEQKKEILTFYYQHALKATRAAYDVQSSDLSRWKRQFPNLSLQKQADGGNTVDISFEEFVKLQKEYQQFVSKKRA